MIKSNVLVKNSTGKNIQVHFAISPLSPILDSQDLFAGVHGKINKD